MARMCSVEKHVVKDGRTVVVCDETRSALLPILQEIQERKGWISDRDMQETAERLGIHPVEVYSVVTFYTFLSTEKKGRHVIRVSRCISSVMAGAEKVLAAFEKALGIRAGQTTPDGRLTLEWVNCVGLCDQAPAVLVDGRPLGRVSPRKVKRILDDLK